MSISIYIININFITKLIKSIYITFDNSLNNKENALELNLNQVECNQKDSKFTLVEEIEELGFIPSLDKNKDSKTI